MNINIDRQDLVNMIHGIDPTFEQMNIPEVAKNGCFSGSYLRWSWSGNFKGISEQALYNLYIELKKTGFDA